MRVLKILRNIILILLALALVAGGVLFYMLSQVPIRAEKHCATIEITLEDEADYRVFLYPYGKYKRIFDIDNDVRYRIADYMKENDLVLSVGEQKFFAIRDASFEELITENFKFEKRR